MNFNKKQISGFIIFSLVILSCTIFSAILLGKLIAWTKNYEIRDNVSYQSMKLPTIIYDRNNEVITRILAEEDREIINTDALSREVKYAFISREDNKFYYHRGYSVANTLRALLYSVFTKNTQGGSSITQQTAGATFKEVNRNERSIKRKVVELWFAIQMEKNLSKNEIIDEYLNRVYFGHGAYGIEAACNLFFNHSAQSIDLGEATVLAIQLAAPGSYSPIYYPNTAKDRQSRLLEHMANTGIITHDDAVSILNNFWNNYNYQSRSTADTRYLKNEDLAPYFTEHVKKIVNSIPEIIRTQNINDAGLSIYTTLDLKYQKIAEEKLVEAIMETNRRYETNRNQNLQTTKNTYIPITNMLADIFNISGLNLTKSKHTANSTEYFREKVFPTLQVLSLFTNNEDLEKFNKKFEVEVSKAVNKLSIEGALVTLENGTGKILTMVGGSDFDTKKFNKATSSVLQPGSAIKPLFYSQAISSKKFTAGTRLPDVPSVFYSNNKPYTPNNYLGTWKHSVLLRHALARSENIPAVQILDEIGFEPAIERISSMLGMEEERYNDRIFPRGHTLALGTITTTPIRMARAYSVFPNRGVAVDPIAIIKIEDKNGNIIYESNKDPKYKVKQIMSPQDAFVMTSILESTNKEGTLKYYTDLEGLTDMPIAMKTGTTQNWADAWSCAFTPNTTSTLWLGFDTPGNSLGRYLTGTTASGTNLIKYISALFDVMPETKDPNFGFNVPETGIVYKTICTESGLLATGNCNASYSEVFVEGTEPREHCEYCVKIRVVEQDAIENIGNMIYYEIISESDIDKLIKSAGLEEVKQETDTLEKLLNQVSKKEKISTKVVDDVNEIDELKKMLNEETVYEYEDAGEEFNPLFM